MATSVQIGVKLVPVGAPCVRINIANFDQLTQLTKPTVFNIQFDSATVRETLLIEHLNKSATDPDTAVIVDSIEFFGIVDPKFAWAGVYCPVYPEPWYSQQPSIPPAEIIGQTYLGWNGTYRLDFDVPVFTWIHQVQNLGWIYQ